MLLHGHQIDSVERPYKFVTFGLCFPKSDYHQVSNLPELFLTELPADTFIQKTKRFHLDTRADRNQLGMMYEDLRDVRGIMTKNIQELLERGEKLESNLALALTPITI